MITFLPDNSCARIRLFHDWSRRASGRSNCYGFLALVFRDVPTLEVVAQLRSGPLAEALGDVGCDVNEWLAGDLPLVTDLLREEYIRTFIGPGPHVSPSASVHHRGEGQSWGDSTSGARHFIGATALSLESDWDSIPGHVAVELEMMQRLCAQEATLWAQCRSALPPSRQEGQEQLRLCLRAEQAFLRDHLSAWLPQFCDRVAATGSGQLYRQMAEVARSIVLHDIELMVEAQEALHSAGPRATRPGAEESRQEPRHRGQSFSEEAP
jgi:TorA maturation chaperone TorD